MSDETTDGRATWIGAFVLGGLALAVALALLLAGGNPLARRTQVVAYFQGSVAGLLPGSPVTFRGVRVGEVREIGLVVDARTLDALIPVTFEVAPRLRWINGEERLDDLALIRDAVARGLRAQLRSQSLVTGQLEVDLDFHPEQPAVFRGTVAAAALPEIPTMRSALAAIQDEIGQLRLGEVVGAAERALAAVAALAARADTEMAGLGSSAATLGASAAAVLGEAGDLLRAARGEVAETLAAIRALSEATQQQVAGRGAELLRLMVSADRTILRADRVLASAGELLGARTAFRGDLEAAARDLSAAAGSLRGFAREVERNPSSLLLGGAGR